MCSIILTDNLDLSVLLSKEICFLSLGLGSFDFRMPKGQKVKVLSALYIQDVSSSFEIRPQYVVSTLECTKF